MFLEVAMSLELVNTLAALATVVIVAATAVAALVQLRHLRAGYQSDAMLNVSEYFNAPAFVDAQDLVNRKLTSTLDQPGFREYVSMALRGQTLPDVAEYALLRRAVIMIGNAYEDLGVLVKNNIIDKSLFFDRYSGIIMRAWNRLSAYAAFSRDVTGKNNLWENFEYLTVLSEDWDQVHPSSYPTGLRRLSIHNPWPIAPVTVTI
jgi:hypothetical protein